MSKQLAIMFADIAGSTRLYETLGNADANERINICLGYVSDCTETNRGTVIKHIGDELMCSFNSADAAVCTALDIQSKLSESLTSDIPPLRIGLHYGEAIERDGDLFGDAVNVAARMVNIAKAKQIITTEQLVAQLNNDYASRARVFDKTKVKGRDEELTIYQIIWEINPNVTTVIELSDLAQMADNAQTIHLLAGGEERIINQHEAADTLSIGREDCDIVLDSTFASRSHAKLQFRRGKFVLSDNSTNGTYVKFKGQDEVFIRREELPLFGKGLISLGHSISSEQPAEIIFTVNPAKEKK